MTEVERLAEFAVRASYADLSEDAREQVKIRVLDSIGCAFGAIDGAPIRLVREHVAEFDGSTEGNKGFMEAVAGHFTIDWGSEDLERVTRTIIKRYNAEMHAQTTIAAVLELKRQHRFDPSEVDGVDVEVFDVAYKIIGGGEEGDKSIVCTKEEADHSLPYLVAVAILDNEVLPPQFAPDRIGRDDVQRLLCLVKVRPGQEYSRRFPGAMAAHVTLTLRDGRVLEREETRYPGLNAPPMSWKHVRQKFELLTRETVAPEQERAIIAAVQTLDAIDVSDLTRRIDIGMRASAPPRGRGAARTGSDDQTEARVRDRLTRCNSTEDSMSASVEQIPRRSQPQPLAASYLEFNIAREIDQLQREAEWDTGRNAKALVKYDDFRVVVTALKARTKLPEHRTEGRISIQTVRGHVLVRAEGRRFDMPAAGLLALDAGVPHEVEALEDSAIVLTIAWPRK